MSHRFASLVAVPLAAALVVGPGAGARTGPQEPALHSSDSLVHVYRAANSNLGYALRAVVHDSATFAGFWAQIAGAWGRVPPAPHVEFRGNTVVVIAAMGRQPTAGSSLRIEAVDTVGPVLTVRISMYGPDQSCSEGLEALNPVDIVRVQQTRPAVVFVEHYEEYSCKN